MQVNKTYLMMSNIDIRREQKNTEGNILCVYNTNVFNHINIGVVSIGHVPRG
jgi:hypothetical protein